MAASFSRPLFGDTDASCSDAGSASVIGVGLVSALLTMTMVVLPLHAALTVRQVVANAADAAALAAADTASGFVSGSPCANARRAAELNGATLVECDAGAGSLDAAVGVQRSVLGVQVRVTARAGPPDPSP